MIRTQIQLTEKQSQSLKEMAVQEQTSVAELIRQAVDHWLHIRGGMSMQEKHKRALAVVREMDGRFHSGCSDLAENHDEYLAEAFGDYEPRTNLS